MRPVTDFDDEQKDINDGQKTMNTTTETANTTAIIRYDFHGDELDLVKEGNNLWISVRRVCEALELSYPRQYRKLNEKPWAVVAQMATTGPDGKNYNTFCLDLDSLPMWLATIDAGRVAHNARDKLVTYQKEAARALRDHFFGGATIRLDQDLPQWLGEITEAAVERRRTRQQATDDNFALRYKLALEALGVAREAVGRAFATRPAETHSDNHCTRDLPARFDIRTYLKDRGLPERAIRRYACCHPGPSYKRLQAYARPQAAYSPFQATDQQHRAGSRNQQCRPWSARTCSRSCRPRPR